MAYTTKKHKEIAQGMQRDAHGHFIGRKSQTPLENVLSHTNISSTHDDNTLIDVHVGNPLRKIAMLLEEIKRQKAFSFTLKGSLGIVGVFVALSFFGILGGSKALCDKGAQSHIGILKILMIAEKENQPLPFLNFLNIFPAKADTVNRTLLVNGEQTIHVTLKNVAVEPLKNQIVIITGRYDDCSKTIELKDPQAIEPYSE